MVLDASSATLVRTPVAAAALGGEVERVQVADRTSRQAPPLSAASVLGEGAPNLHLTKRSYPPNSRKVLPLKPPLALPHTALRHFTAAIAD